MGLWIWKRRWVGRRVLLLVMMSCRRRYTPSLLCPHFEIDFGIVLLECHSLGFFSERKIPSHHCLLLYMSCVSFCTRIPNLVCVSLLSNSCACPASFHLIQSVSFNLESCNPTLLIQPISHPASHLFATPRTPNFPPIYTRPPSPAS